MKNELKIIGIQADLIWEKPKKNISFFEEKINSFKDPVDLIVLPEMFTTGFTMKPETVAEQMDGFTVKWMQQMAKSKNTAICGSLVIKEKNNYYNRFVFVDSLGNKSTYDKRHLFTLAKENKAYTSGNKQILINYKGWRICPLICYDLRFPVWARNTKNYDLLIFVANWPIQRIKAWETLIKARAIENMCYAIGVNRTGEDKNGYNYSGNSLIVNFLGEELSTLDLNKVGIVNASITKKILQDTRNNLGFLNDKDSFKIDL